jgi:hypothetical protein
MPDLTAPIPGANVATLVQRRHPLYPRWEEDERKSRASYLATRRHLAPFIVPHRFEGDKRPQDLKRAQLGYGIGLNQGYLHEIFGHIRSAPQTTEYKPLTDAEWDTLDDDVTGTGQEWRNFFEGVVLEWMLTSTGGFVIIDAPPPPKAATSDSGETPPQPRTKADEQRLGLRPYARWVPMSKVVDCGRDEHGFRWLRVLEEIDTRTPDGDTRTLTQCTVTYLLLEDGGVQVRRVDAEGNELLNTTLKPILFNGKPILPVVQAKYGVHPDIEWLGAGLLMGLDDIIIDMFNVLSEVREAYRDAAFGLLVYTGDDYEEVKRLLTDGSRLVGLGAHELAKLDRLAVDAAEVDAGLRLIELGLKNWALAAKRKAAEAAEAVARSGVSLQAEFQLDLKPLLVSIAESLSEVEEMSLYIFAQMYGYTPEAAAKIECDRDTNFKLEEEASRISRLVGEFLKTLDLPGEAIRQITLRWLESSDLVDLEAKRPGAEGQVQQVDTRTLVEQQVAALADAKQSMHEQQTGFGVPFAGPGAGSPV